MSLITRCPACGTMFKVVPDQLRISEGWVRCGHCANVFDAAAHLQPDEAVVAGAGPSAAKAEAPSMPARVAPEPDAFVPSVHSEIDESLLSEAPDSAQLDEEAQALRETPLDQPFELRRQDAGDAQGPVSLPRAEVEREPELHDLSFVRQARRKEFWTRPFVRAMMLLALIALGLLLALQVAVHDRDRLAAADPGLRPLLGWLCEPLHCTVGPPRQIDSIAIDSSTFIKLRGDTYRLNVTLKNQATTEVAMPALELTLTDVQDQAVIRRVLTPAELAPQVRVIAAGSEWSGSFALAVAANGASSRISGYRLLAFYP